MGLVGPEGRGSLLIDSNSIGEDELESYHSFLFSADWYPSMICQVLRQHSKDALDESDLIWHSNEKSLAQASIDGGVHCIRCTHRTDNPRMTGGRKDHGRAGLDEMSLA